MMMFSIAESSSSVEALAFSYFRLGFYVVVNNLWTLVAVVTAAISFWRFKLVPSLARRRFRSPTAVDAAAELQSQPAPVPAPAARGSCERGNDGGAVKGDRVYSRVYYDDVIVDEEEEEEEGFAGVHGCETLRFDASERLRLLDLGFYEYQDLRVLDGNVVKLWESCSASSSPRAAARAAVLGRPMWFG